MSDELVLYTNPQSRGQIVRWMLEELGQPYRTEILGYAGTMKSPEYLAINPMGKVPALKHGDVVVTEAGAICAYLADAFPQAGLAPPLGDKRRGPYFRWMFFAAGPLEAAITNQSLGVQIPPERKQMVGYGCLEDTVNAAETALKAGDYLLGEQFSAADVYFGSAIGFFLQFGSLEPRPLFTAYAERLQNRPAAIRAREIDAALVAGQPQPA
jgi:glutathione S-transferase